MLKQHFLIIEKDSPLFKALKDFATSVVGWYCPLDEGDLIECAIHTMYECSLISDLGEFRALLDDANPEDGLHRVTFTRGYGLNRIIEHLWRKMYQINHGIFNEKLVLITEEIRAKMVHRNFHCGFQFRHPTIEHISLAQVTNMGENFRVMLNDGHLILYYCEW